MVEKNIEYIDKTKMFLKNAAVDSDLKIWYYIIVCTERFGISIKRRFYACQFK